MIKEINKIRNAKGQLKKLADGEYHSLAYDLSEYSSGEIGIICKVYIHGYEYETAATWEDALQKMRKHVKARKERTL